jgi:DTW domain-containing protein
MNTEGCAGCLKPTDLCVCGAIRPLNTRMHVLILQHPQEPDKELGTARLAHLALPNSTLRIGLSWPNLKAALAKEARPSAWAVLYLGSGLKQENPKILQLVDRKGAAPPATALASTLEGIVVLDGTWSQAKALWWRNPWLLKLKRAVLSPPARSLYRELRREPRRECLSTIESIALALDELGESPSIGNSLRSLFGTLLDRERGRQAARARSR